MPDELERLAASAEAGTALVRDILESLCRRDGLSLESGVVPGEPARNYELAERLGIGHVFGLKEPDMTDLRCHFDNDGWLQGPINIRHVMTPNHGTGFGTGRGIVMHTEDGFEAGTFETFMDPANQVSAFFSIGQSGAATQYLPVGKGFCAFTQAGGNEAWRGIEDEDRTHPSVPLTQAQITAFAQILEACSAFDGFPLKITDDVNGQGLILHSDGGQNWGGHPDCPGPVRAAQRSVIIALAMSIRQAASGPKRWTAEGQLSLHDLAATHLGEDVTSVLATTARNSAGAVFEPALASYVNTVFAADAAKCPAGVTWHYPGKAGTAATWLTHGQDSLHALAAQLGTLPSRILEVTADVTGTGPLQALASQYIDGCFERSALHVPAGCVLLYGVWPPRSPPLPRSSLAARRSPPPPIRVPARLPAALKTTPEVPMALPSLDHDCEHGGGAVGGVIAVQQKASSHCCGAVLAEGGTDEAGHSCTGCSQPCTKVMASPVAHWTCLCGQRRFQVVTEPQDAI